jgi:hypothetical protein
MRCDVRKKIGNALERKDQEGGRYGFVGEIGKVHEKRKKYEDLKGIKKRMKEILEKGRTDTKVIKNREKESEGLK